MGATDQGVRIASIRGWTGQGWRELRRDPWGAMLYAAIFTLIGLGLRFWLTHLGYSLFYTVLASGFLLLAPSLSLAYYGSLQALRQGERVGLGRRLQAFFRSPPAVWAVLLFTGAMFLIWVTDALIVYSVYFDFDPLPGVFSDPALRGQAFRFILFSHLLFAVLAFITFVVSVFSIPHILLRNSGMVDGVVYSVKGVFGHFLPLLLWAVLSGFALLLVLQLALPLLLLALPLFAYSNFACYEQLVASKKG